MIVIINNDFIIKTANFVNQYVAVKKDAKF